MKHAEIVGKTFGFLTILHRTVTKGYDGRAASWLCSCQCGGTIVARSADLLRGKTKSCGCLKSKSGLENSRFRHGATTDYKAWPEYQAWSGMKQRCHNPKAPKYSDYGQRGIKVCDKWRDDFMAFFNDVGQRPDGLTLDRIENDGNYEPGNVRWATRSEQQQNRRTSPKYRSNHPLPSSGLI